MATTIAAIDDLRLKWELPFWTFFTNLTRISNLTVSLESQWNADSYCPYANTVNFSRMSRIHFCAKNTPLKWTGPKNSKTSPFPWGTWTPSNTQMPKPTLLTNPNDNNGYNWTPQIHPKTAPYASMITTPYNTSIHRPAPLIIPNGIRIQSAVLPQYTFQTDRHTHSHTTIAYTIWA